jgi:hypothetical protein
MRARLPGSGASACRVSRPGPALACAHGATGGTRWTPGGGHRRVLAVVAYLNP